MNASTSESVQESSATRLVRVIDIVLYLALWLAALWIGPHSVLWVAGLCVSAVAFVVWMIARRQLGRSFMIGVQAKQLVTHGLYRRFRHPIYLFGGVAHFAALVALQNWWILATWMLYALAIQWARVQREDLVLEAAFGDEFREHRKAAWI